MAWNLLLNYSLFPNYSYMQQQQFPAGIGEQLDVVRYKRKLQKGSFGEEEEEEEVGCAVCLCKIEEDDEVRELRCNHLFHKVCLDRWLGHSLSTTCPICRTFLTPTKVVAGVEVLLFKYTTVTSDRRDSWWLR